MKESTVANYSSASRPSRPRWAVFTSHPMPGPSISAAIKEARPAPLEFGLRMDGRQIRTLPARSLFATASPCDGHH